VRESIVRDKLALERTYLAWMRTSLVVLSLGIGFLQLDRFLSVRDEDEEVVSVRNIGRILVVSSPVLSLYSVFRYFRALHSLNQNRFAAATVSVVVFSGALASCTFAAVPIVMTKKPTTSTTITKP